MKTPSRGAQSTGEWLMNTIKQNPEGLLLVAAGAVLMMRQKSGNLGISSNSARASCRLDAGSVLAPSKTRPLVLPQLPRVAQSGSIQQDARCPDASPVATRSARTEPAASGSPPTRPPATSAAPRDYGPHVIRRGTSY